MKAGEGVAFCPPMGGGCGVRTGNKHSNSPTPWAVSFFSSINEGIRQTVSVQPQGLSPFQMDTGTSARTGDMGISHKEKLYRKNEIINPSRFDNERNIKTTMGTKRGTKNTVHSSPRNRG